MCWNYYVSHGKCLGPALTELQSALVVQLTFNEHVWWTVVVDRYFNTSVEELLEKHIFMFGILKREHCLVAMSSARGPIIFPLVLIWSNNSVVLVIYHGHWCVYRLQSCEIISTPDQNETDFTKCLRLVVQKLKDSNLQAGFFCFFIVEKNMILIADFFN